LFLKVCGWLAWTCKPPSANVPDLPNPFWRGAEEETASLCGDWVPTAWECCGVPEGADLRGASGLPACGKRGWTTSGV